jgi:ABC-2 type transport system ATP-binding protein
MTHPPAVELDAVVRTFGGRAALDGVSLSVARGEVFGLLGPDGAGKSTLMRIMATVLPPTSGAARTLGLDTVEDSTGIKRRIGYMSQRFGLYPDLTVAENVRFYADLYGVDPDSRARRCGELLRRVGMLEFAGRRAGKLSGGMRQKLALVCSLIHTPELLVLDEPTNGVDPVSRREFWKLLREMAGGDLTVIVSTAYLEEAEWCDRMALLHGGRVLAAGRRDEVAGLMSDAVLSISTSDPGRARKLLSDSAPGLRTWAWGERVHVATAFPEEDAGRVRSILLEAGMECEVGRVEPELEDVFVAAVGDCDG